MLAIPGGIILSRSFDIGSFPCSHPIHVGLPVIFFNICRTLFCDVGLHGYCSILQRDFTYEMLGGFCFLTVESVS